MNGTPTTPQKGSPPDLTKTRNPRRAHLYTDLLTLPSRFPFSPSFPRPACFDVVVPSAKNNTYRDNKSATNPKTQYTRRERERESEREKKCKTQHNNNYT